MYDESDLLPISALQHLIFCPRQCALIHNERQWVENRLTVEGRQMHERAHAETHEVRDGVRLARALPVRSLRLGLYGICDVVEFEPPNGPPHRVTPVEYKRGRPKSHEADRVQLCAQALCLEEMLGVSISDGGLFYGKTRRRKGVILDASLREHTRQTAMALHKLINSGETPPAAREAKCDRCSLLNICMPSTQRKQSARAVFGRLLKASLNQLAPEDPAAAQEIDL